MALHAAPWMARIKRFEASGMAAQPGTDTLVVVGDEGGLLHIPLDAPEQMQRDTVEPRGDLEGLAFTPDQRLLVLAEDRDAVWQLDGHRRVHRWKIRPGAPKKNRGYEGMTCTPERLLLCLGEKKKRSILRSFALPVPGEDALVLLGEQTLPVPDLAGLCWHGGVLFALSDKGRVLVVLQPDSDKWVERARYGTPAGDLEAVAVAGGALFLAQDGGGIWRAPMPAGAIGC